MANSSFFSTSLETKLSTKQNYVKTKYDYYNDKQTYGSYVGSEVYEVSSDSIKLTIDDLRNKLLVSHFINANNFEDYFTKNFLNKVIKSCLINGCAFARILKNADGTIELIPYDAFFATGKLNNNNLLDEAISIDDTDENGNPIQVTHYSKDKSITRYLSDKKDITNKNNGVVPLIPLIVNQNALKPFGDSFITKRMMKDTNSLKRNKERVEVISQTLSQANAFLLGVSRDFKKDVSSKALKQLEHVVLFTKDIDGDSPELKTRDNGLSELEQKIKDLEQSIKYDVNSPAYKDMVESIRQDIIDSINLIANVMIKIIKDDPNAKLDGAIDIVFKNNDFINLSATMDGILKTNQASPGYYGKEQIDKVLGMNGNKSKLIESIKDNNFTQKDIEKLITEVESSDI